MKSNRVFHTIDTHTGGNPTRTLLRGMPPLCGKTMAEKMLHMRREYDWIRTFLMYEPRGHDVMSGALLVEPCHPEADIGVIYIETGGYLPMCGHDTIGVCTALVETGLIDVKEPLTRLKLDTPAGLVVAEIEVENGKAKQVSFQNVPSFLYTSAEVELDGIRVRADIAYGGNFYAIVDADAFGLRLVPEEASRIIDCAVRLRRVINREVDVGHPEAPYIRGVTHMEFYSHPTHPEAHVKNTVVVPPGGIDRSPCGTGTSAKLAVLFARGEIGIGEEFVHESIVGSLFRGRVVRKTKVGTLDAVVTKVTGSAWVMGMHTFFAHEDDELNHGFLLIPPVESD
jgi:proline racemase